jgi:antirestriction protein ArdC
LKPQNEKRDVAAEVTAQVIAHLEKGVLPWSKPWDDGGVILSRPLRSTGEPYQGINVFLLWMAAMEAGYRSNHWITYEQAKRLGGNVKRGEKGTMVVLYKPVSRTEVVDNEEVTHNFRMMKTFTVFNIDQCDGLPEGKFPTPTPITETLTEAERIAGVEVFIKATGALIVHRGVKAFYAPGGDFIQMPPFATFKEAVAYYGTVLHELIHWTKHKKRLDRNNDNAFVPGDESYAAEELVAEMGAAIMSVILGITPVVRDDHSQYIGYWLGRLKNDKRLIFSAAAKAQEAADYLQSLVNGDVVMEMMAA